MPSRDLLRSPGFTESKTRDLLNFVAIGHEHLAIRYHRHKRAQRYTLRLFSDAEVRITIPLEARVQQARRFIENQKTWLNEQLELRRNSKWKDGSLIFFRGELVRLKTGWNGIQTRIQFGTETFAVEEPLGRDLALPVKRYLQELANRELPERMWQLSNLHKTKIVKVTVRDQRARWGSCSSSGAISLNWRLIQVPVAVRDYVMIHELMHISRFDHSPKFWSLVESICPHWRDHRAWLHANWRLLNS
jgi:predicted metal-dependent hydrolase